MRIRNLESGIRNLMPAVKTLCVMALCLCAVGLTSCDHKELCYHHPHIVKLYLEFDWRDAPEANPAGMSVYFYPMEGTDAPVRRIDFTGTGGGEIDIQIGHYRVITYNNDTEVSQFNYTDAFDSHQVFTRAGDLFEAIPGVAAGANAPRPKDTENERVVVTPDEVYGCYAIDVEITETGVSYKCFPFEEKDDWVGKDPIVTENVITLYPHDYLCVYTYEIRNVSGLDGVTQMCATLSGMSPILLLGDETLHKECVTLPFGAEVHEDGSTIVGSFLTFGHHEENSQPHRMGLYVWMKDGTRYFYGADGGKFDVTDQVHSAPDRRRVHLIIDGLDLPQAFGEGDEDLDASFDDWQEVNVDIDL